jgi:FkbM family methyltransferase
MQPPTPRSKYSEYEEEPFLRAWFKHDNGFFVDIGANNGWKGSNTYALFLRGWSGICVEPDPRTFQNLVKTYNQTNRVRCVNAAVWDRKGEIDFDSHLDDDSGLSRVDHSGHANMRPFKVRCMTLETLLENAPPIDFLTIDAEGCDYAIVCAYDWRVKPSLVMVEYGGTCSAGNFLEFFHDKNYEEVFRSKGNIAFAMSESLNDLRLLPLIEQYRNDPNSHRRAFGSINPP